MNYSEVETILKDLPNGYYIKVGGVKLDKELFEALFNVRFSSELSESKTISMVNSRGNTMARVYLLEAFECCGKAYMYSFSGIPHYKYLIKICELLAKQAGYSYLGFTHRTNSDVVEAGLKLDFIQATTYLNKRSENTLAEMYKII